MDILLRPGKIIYRVLGGVFDFYIMLGPSPVDVSVQYSDIVGRTALMPLWSFGWHQWLAYLSGSLFDYRMY